MTEYYIAYQLATLQWLPDWSGCGPDRSDLSGVDLSGVDLSGALTNVKSGGITGDGIHCLPIGNSMSA